MAFGVFDAAIGSEYEVAMAKQASVDKLTAATYDVREKLGPILFASHDVEEFRHKVAMMKEDQSVFKIIEASGLFPTPGHVRKIVGRNSILENEFTQRLADGGAAIPGVVPTPPPGAMPQDNVAPLGVGATPPDPGMGVSGDPAAGQISARLHRGCWPGCDENEAHAAKFHKDKADKEGRRQAVYDTINHPKWDNGMVDTNETFEGGKTDTELKPKGDFKGYLNKVDQGAPSKVKRNFASRATVARYTAFCKRRALSPIRMSSLDTFAENSGLTTPGYFRLAATIQAWENEHKPKVPSTKLPKTDKVASQDPMGPYKAWCRKHGLRMISARNINHYAGRDLQLAYFLGMRCKQAIKVARRRQAADPRPGVSPDGMDVSAADDYAQAQTGTGAAGPNGYRATGRRRQAAPDYLQKADDALTQLLNQKAEEFQQTIQPLQMALQTVQQAEQLQQQQNPLNVLPTPGTVNVMPGQQQSPAAQIGMPDPNAPDLSAAVQALANPIGGAPPDGGGAPPGGGAPTADAGAPPPAAGGGGLPPDIDPSQKAARHRGKGRGVARPRQAAGVGEMWDNWRKQKNDSGEALRGGDVDYEQFRNEKGVGDRALTKLKQRNQTPDFEPINGAGRGAPAPKVPGGVTVGRRKQAWSGWGPSVAPKTRHVAGWDWDNHLNGYLSTKPQHFACNCGENFPAPSGFQRCACGRQWNSYVIGTGGSGRQAAAEKFIVREVPVRPDVIVANRKLGNYEDMPDTSPKPIVGKPADSDYHLDRGNTNAAWALQKEKQHGKPLSQFSGDDWAIAGNPPSRHHAVQLVDPRTGGIVNLIDPGEAGEGKDPGHATFRPQPKDWARRSGDGKWQGSAIG